MGYQSNQNATPTVVSRNQQEVLTIDDQNIDLEKVFYLNDQNVYAIVNENLVTCIDIRLRKVGGAGEFGSLGTGGTILKLPAPEGVSGFVSWTTQSTEGNQFYCRMSSFGIVVIEGQLTSDLDEIVLNFPSYIAKTPLEFATVPAFNIP
ncbi:hypothetical protein [Aquimarina pacifica]|uniref:hypothetical protein n=1 Tax=Aquimarina pacifica TaxID=1296415 RepID=UPI00046EEF58|nr:hypothetical protein [Aquimarina pacifica]